MYRKSSFSNLTTNDLKGPLDNANKMVSNVMGFEEADWVHLSNYRL